MQNVGHGPAKNITFEFSSPVESSDGFELSELAFFEEGITSLAPGGRIVCYWDELGNLQEMFQEERLQRGIAVTVNYQTSPGLFLARVGDRSPALRGVAYRRVQGRK